MKNTLFAIFWVVYVLIAIWGLKALNPLRPHRTLAEKRVPRIVLAFYWIVDVAALVMAMFFAWRFRFKMN